MNSSKRLTGIPILKSVKARWQWQFCGQGTRKPSSGLTTWPRRLMTPCCANSCSIGSTFDRAQQAIRDQKLEVAKKLAAKFAEFDHRAYLYLKIAEETIKSTKSDAY